MLTNVVDVEVARKLLGKFMDERKLREPAKGSTQQADDICSKIKQINQRVMSGAHSHHRRDGGGDAVAPTYYNPQDPATSSSSSSLHVQRLDELLDELKTLAHDMESFLSAVHSLAKQSVDLLTGAVQGENQAREEAQRKRQLQQQQQTDAGSASPLRNGSGSANSSNSSSNKKSFEESFGPFLANPHDLSLLPSVHEQHDRTMTLLHRLLQEDKSKRNLLSVPIVDEKPNTNVFAPSSSKAKPPLPLDAPVPPAQLHLSSTSPFLVHGFGLEGGHLATASQLYDVLLTLIGKYVLVEEYFMNVNVVSHLALRAMRRQQPKGTECSQDVDHVC
jgi:hypothetical protein